ncbi:MAG: septum formation initiator family protein [Lachnospiraceae bacterium]|nr:septum formation initiator family protein [Lachnospiraceae bacterium]
MRSSKRRNRRGEKLSIGLIVLLLLVAMTVQIVRLKQKEQAYAEQVEKLQQEYEAETQRAEDLKKLEAYMQTPQYIEDIAKSKLGLAYDNEIIFKESDE